MRCISISNSDHLFKTYYIPASVCAGTLHTFNLYHQPITIENREDSFIERI